MKGIQPITHDVATNGGGHDGFQLISVSCIPRFCTTHIAQGQSMARIPARCRVLLRLWNSLSMKNLEMDELSEQITLFLQITPILYFSPFVVANIEEGIFSNDHGELHIRELLAEPSYKINTSKLTINYKKEENGNRLTGNIY